MIEIVKSGHVKLFLLPIIAIMLLSCATGKPFQKVFISGEDQSVIYIYRPLRFSGGGGSPDILINNETVLDLLNGGYSWFYVKAGRYSIKITAPPYFASSIDLSVEPHRSYFVRWVPEVAGWSVDPVFLAVGELFINYEFKGSMTLVGDEFALAEISKCKYIKPAKIIIDPIEQ